MKLKKNLTPKKTPLNKKAVVEIQFNWIFIMIVGAIILMFFITIVVQQSRQSNKKIAASITFDMSSIFSGAQISTNTEHIVDIPPLNLHFECDNNSGYSSYRIEDSERPIGDSLVVFSPSYIYGKGRKLLTWSVDWNAPYRVTNFLFLSTPLMRYLIWNGTNGNARGLFDDLPDKMMKDNDIYQTVAGISNMNNYKVRIVKLYESGFDPYNDIVNAPVDLQYMAGTDLTMVYIDPQNSPSRDSLNEWGHIYFFKSNGIQFELVGRTYYFDRASIYGAIFSETYENYNCNMNKAFERLFYVTKIYESRAQGLLDHFSTSSDPQNCFSKILTAKNYLTSIKTASQNGFFTTDTEASTFYQNVVDLKTQNKNIQRHSCPVIY